MKPGSLKKSSALSRYIPMRIPPLEYERERALLRRAKQGDRGAADTLVRAHLGFVLVYVAKRNLGRLGIDDAVQEGQLGILRAIEKFNLSRPVKFATYATWWMHAFIDRAVHESRSVVHQRAGQLVTHDQHLDAPLHEDGSETELDGMASDGPSPEEAHVGADLAERVRAVVGQATAGRRDLDLDIVANRLSKGDDRDTLATIAHRYGLSRERVRQREIQVRKALGAALADLAEEAA